MMAAEAEWQQILASKHALHVILVSLITGKREWPDSMMTGRKSSTGWDFSMVTIWERGDHDVAHAQLGNFEHALDRVLVS